MEFKLKLYQTDEDCSAENNVEKTCTISVNSSYPKIRIQVPEAHGGLCDENKVNLTYTPEDMFLSAISGCFFTTFNVVAKNSNLAYIRIEISSKGNMEEVDNVKMVTEISQDITLTLAKGEEKHERKAKKVMEIAEKRCAMANSVKSKVTNTYTVKYI